MNTDDDNRTAALLAQALRDEAAMTEPAPDALQRIQDRTSAAPSSGAISAAATASSSSERARRLGAETGRGEEGRSRTRWLGGAFGAGLATAAVITAVVAIGVREADNSAPPATQPTQSDFTTAEPTAAEQTEPGPTAEPTQAEPTGNEPPTPKPTSSAEPTAGEPGAEEPIGLHQGVYDPNASADRQVTMYYAGHRSKDFEMAPRLYSEPHTLPEEPDDPALAAAREWWTSLPIDPDLMPVLMGNESLLVVDVSTVGQTTTIAIESLSAASPEGEPLLVGDHLVGSPAQQRTQVLPYFQALLRTAGVEGEARFTYNGEPVDESNGVRLDPLRVMSDEEVRAWIEIVSPVEEEVVTNPVTATVSANVFEGSVNWQLFNAADKLIDEGFVTTAMGSWEQADIELGNLAPGRYRLRCLEYSAEDGRPMNIVDKTFSVE